MQNSNDNINRGQTEETNQESDAEMSPFMAKVVRLLGNTAVRNTLGIILAVGITIGASAELNHMSHGSDSPEKFGQNNPSIGSVIIEDEAPFRYDPAAGTGENNNLIQEFNTENPKKIYTPNGVYIKKDEINGDFYGIKSQDLEKAIPGFDDKGDNDDTVWVNSQKATLEDINKK